MQGNGAGAGKEIKGHFGATMERGQFADASEEFSAWAVLLWKKVSGAMIIEGR